MSMIDESCAYETFLYCDRTKERAVTRLWHAKQLLSVTTIAHKQRSGVFCGVHVDSNGAEAI
jgi:hypothetical protein